VTSTLPLLLRDDPFTKGKQQHRMASVINTTSINVSQAYFRSFFKLSCKRLRTSSQYVTNVRKISQRKAKKREIATTATVIGTSGIVST
jgi:hypothetical protein